MKTVQYKDGSYNKATAKYLADQLGLTVVKYGIGWDVE